MTKPIQIKNLTLGAGIPKICVPLTGTTEEKICQEAEDAKKAGADLVEWRADFYEELQNDAACTQVLEKISQILKEIPSSFYHPHKRRRRKHCNIPGSLQKL